MTKRDYSYTITPNPGSYSNYSVTVRGPSLRADSAQIGYEFTRWRWTAKLWAQWIIFQQERKLHREAKAVTKTITRGYESKEKDNGSTDK